MTNSKRLKELWTKISEVGYEDEDINDLMAICSQYQKALEKISVSSSAEVMSDTAKNVLGDTL